MNGTKPWQNNSNQRPDIQLFNSISSSLNRLRDFCQKSISIFLFLCAAFSRFYSEKMVRNLKHLLTAEFLRFLIVGVISAALEFSLLILFVEKLSVQYLLGNIIAFALTNILTYLLSSRFVFGASTSSNRVQEAAMFFLCLAGGLVVNQLVLWVLVEFTVIDYRIAKVAAIGLTVIWNFFTRKHFVFRNREVAPQRITEE